MRFTAMNRGQRGKLAMATAALGIGLLSVTGCGYINPQQTSEQYSASDGTRTDLGPLELRNFIIIADGEDKPARVIGAVYNTSGNDVVLTVKGTDGSQAEVPVKQKSYTMLNDSTAPVLLGAAGAKPGSMAEVTISEDGASQNAQFAVPVLDGTIVDYKSYLPTPEPTATSTESASTGTATSTETATPTPSTTAGH